MVTLTSTKSPPEMVNNARLAFRTGKTRFSDFRKKQLMAMLRLFEENKDLLYEGLKKDCGKPKFEAYSLEIESLIDDLKVYISKLLEYTSPEYKTKPLLNILDTVYTQSEPYGVVLIISPWNFPVRLVFLPLIGAIAAGNVVVIKPSEIAPCTAKIISNLIFQYLDNECYQVFLGGPEETSILLHQEFDYVFFTGSARIGRIVYEACAKNLTPATLELGGKNPVYLHETANLEAATRRIIWGKFLNAGQVCLGIDYLLCSKRIEKQFLKVAMVVLKDFFGENPINSPDFGRIINETHLQRLQQLILNMKVIYGGRIDLKNKYMDPTILTDVRLSDPVMQDEIFGPILPIVNVETVSEAIEVIKFGDKPLAVYIFTEEINVAENIIRNTSSGGVCVNDIIAHAACPSLPFGGVGKSGMGVYHGKYNFDTFSHTKPVLISDFRSFRERVMELRYPPYSDEKLKKIMWLFKYRPLPKKEHLIYGLAFVCGMFVMYILK